MPVPPERSIFFPNSPASRTVLHCFNASENSITQQSLTKPSRRLYNTLYFIKSGEGNLNFLESKIYVCPGDLYLLPANIGGKLKTSTELHFISVDFQLLFDGQFDLFCLLDHPNKTKLSNSDAAAILLQKIVYLSERNNGFDFEERSKLLAKLLPPFIEHLQRNIPDGNVESYLRFIPVLNQIAHTPNSSVTTQQLARSLKIGDEYFARQFKTLFKVPPKRYILRKRIATAKRELVSTGKTIVSIAAACGFPSSEHFAKTFKKETSYTPSEYRKRYTQA